MDEDSLPARGSRAGHAAPRRRRSGRRLLLVVALIVLLSGGAYALYRDSTATKQPAATPSPTATSSASAVLPQVSPSPPPAPGTTAINFLTAFIHPGGMATVLALAGPGATCSMLMQDAAHKRVSTPGVVSTKTDPRGIVTWSWLIAASQPLGSYSIAVTCSPGKTATSTMVIR